MKVTDTVQDDPAASVLAHVVVRAKSPALAPATEMLLIDNGAEPELVNVTDFAGVVAPICCDPKLRLGGDSETAGDAVAPVPPSETW